MDEKWKKSLKEYRNDRREEIVEAALELFLEKDLANVTMKDIVANASISRVTLYKYFKSVHEIVFEIQMKVFREMNQYLLQSMAKGENGIYRLKLLFEAMLVFFDKKPNYLRFMSLFDHYYRNTYPTSELEEKYKVFLKDEVTCFYVIREGVKDGSLRSDIDEDLVISMVGNTLVGMGQRMAVRGHLIGREQDVNPKDVLQQVFNVLYEFLKAE
ncbi:TetR/AcrR family transcriptional regulator [Bacillus taeanensis]|nr:TetR/AcrR family transcriptional regulator [Bacillus taeanensis]